MPISTYFSLDEVLGLIFNAVIKEKCKLASQLFSLTLEGFFPKSGLIEAQI